MDVILFREFLQWMDERSVSHDQPFLARIYKEDVGPCLNFPNKEVDFFYVSNIVGFYFINLLIRCETPKSCARATFSRACNSDRHQQQNTVVLHAKKFSDSR